MRIWKQLLGFFAFFAQDHDRDVPVPHTLPVVLHAEVS